MTVAIAMILTAEQRERLSAHRGPVTPMVVNSLRLTRAQADELIESAAAKVEARQQAHDAEAGEQEHDALAVATWVARNW